MAPMVVDPERLRVLEHDEDVHERLKSHRDGEFPYPQKKAGKGV